MTDKKMGNVIGAMELEVNDMFMTPESTQDLFGHPMFEGNPDCVVAAMMNWNLIASKQKSDSEELDHIKDYDGEILWAWPKDDWVNRGKHVSINMWTDYKGDYWIGIHPVHNNRIDKSGSSKLAVYRVEPKIEQALTPEDLSFRNREVLSGDDLTKLIHHTVKAWADEEAELNDDGDPILSPHRYFEMMKQLSDECYLNRHNYSLSYEQAPPAMAQQGGAKA